MLIQLVLRNVLSFRDETVFTMASDGGVVERIAGVYGANAAGKSNLVKALALLKRLVVRGARQDETLRARGFALDERTRRASSTFEIVLRTAEHRYEYAITHDRKQIVAEALYRNDALAFERDAGGIRFGEAWIDEHQFLDFVARGTRANQPFLTEAASKNVSAANVVRDWFRRTLRIVDAEGPPLDAARLAREPALRTELGSRLDAWGTGAQQMRVTPAKQPDPIYVPFADSKFMMRLDANDGPTHRVTLAHRSAAGSATTIRFDDESDGTQRLLGLLPLLHDKTPRVYVIDELDRSLHAALTRRFVDEFRANNTNSQLIFTSHDTTLLTGALQKPEELWFAEKDDTGASTLYSLAEFKPEQLAGLQDDLARGYLSGRFGAVPFPIATGAPPWLRGTGS